jgi:hypothetical protein
MCGTKRHSKCAVGEQTGKVYVLTNIGTGVETYCCAVFLGWKFVGIKKTLIKARRKIKRNWRLRWRKEEIEEV